MNLFYAFKKEMIHGKKKITASRVSTKQRRCLGGVGEIFHCGFNLLHFD